MLTPAQYVQALRADGEALARAAEGSLDRPVASCPGWTVADVVRHTGAVHRHKAAIIRHGGTERPDIPWDDSGPADPATLLDWYREGLEDLAALLESSDPQTPAFSWTGDHRVAFWQRRMAQETLVHRCDAEEGAGTGSAVDPALAADGVDEFLTAFMPRNEQPYPGPDGTLGLDATDTGDRWSVLLEAGAATLPGGAQPDATVSTTAAELLLVLWRRRPLVAESVTGDRTLVDAFLAWNELD